MYNALWLIKKADYTNLLTNADCLSKQTVILKSFRRYLIYHASRHQHAKLLTNRLSGNPEAQTRSVSGKLGGAAESSPGAENGQRATAITATLCVRLPSHQLSAFLSNQPP